MVDDQFPIQDSPRFDFLFLIIVNCNSRDRYRYGYEAVPSGANELSMGSIKSGFFKLKLNSSFK